MANNLLNIDISRLPKSKKKEFNKILKLMDKAKEVVQKVELAADAFEQSVKAGR